MSDLNPRAVACPTCRAKPGAPCKRPSGHRVFGGASHSARVKAAEAKPTRTAVDEAVASKQTLNQVYRARLKHAFQGLFPWTETAELHDWKFKLEPLGSKRWTKAKRCRVTVTVVFDNTTFADATGER